MFNQVFRFAAVLLVSVLLTGCFSKWAKVTLPAATEHAHTIETSPVSGTELEKAVAELKLDERLLYMCLVPLPSPDASKINSLVDATAWKRTETALYYDCAYRHNALVEFLATRLGIRAAPKPESEQESKAETERDKAAETVR